MTRPFLEPLWSPGGPIGGQFWELLRTIFVLDFRLLFGEPFGMFWGGPGEQKHTNTYGISTISESDFLPNLTKHGHF